MGPHRAAAVLSALPGDRGQSDPLARRLLFAGRSYPDNQGANLQRLDPRFAPVAAKAGALTVQLPASGGSPAYSCSDGVHGVYAALIRCQEDYPCTWDFAT